MKLSYQQKRLGSGIFTLLLLVTLGNYFLDWGLFGRFDNHAIAASCTLLFLYLVTADPSVEEMREHHKGKDKGVQRESANSGAWIYGSLLVFVMLAVVFVGPGMGLLSGEPVPPDHWINVAFVEALLIVFGIAGWRRLKSTQNTLAEHDEDGD